MHQLLQDRPKSGFPVSIGTGLSLETIFSPLEPVYDPERKLPPKVDTSNYNLYIFNVATLLRNIISSISFKDLTTIPKKDIAHTLSEEIAFLDSFFRLNDLHVSFYYNSYTYPNQTYSKVKGKLRKPTTDKQLFTDSVFESTLKEITKNPLVKTFTNKLEYGKTTSALLFTHIPWDLLSYPNFYNLDLLESNTGLVKSRKLWNTKYFKVPNKDLSNLPFMEYLLVTLGDHVMFSPDPLNKRLDVLDQLERKKVHPLMSEFSLSFLT